MPLRSLSLVLLFIVLSSQLAAGTLTVTTVADSGPGSFRDVLTRMNEGTCSRPCTVDFNIPGPVPEKGYFTIQPLSPLPILFADYVVIDGYSQSGRTGDTNRKGPEIELDGTFAGYRSGIKFGRVYEMTIQGLAVHSFQGHGIFIENSSGVAITGCHIGVDATGTEARPNGFDGIAIRRVLGNTRIAGNIISGNRGNGIYLESDGGIVIGSNRIGIGNESIPLGNGANGIAIIAAQNVEIDSNQIAHNRDFGITVGDHSVRIDIQSNSIYANGLLSIDLGHDGVDGRDPLDADGGANGRMNAPEITEVRSETSRYNQYKGSVGVMGEIRSKPNSEIIIDAYAAPYRGRLGNAESRLWLERTFVRTNANGRGEFEIGSALTNRTVPGGWLTVTATSMSDGTSEYSEPVPIITRRFAVTTVADAGEGSLRDAIERANASDCGNEMCWITFIVPPDQLTNGVAVFEPLSLLPPLMGSVHVDGTSQSWFQGETNGDDLEIEIRGTYAGDSSGLQLGTDEDRTGSAVVSDLVVRGFQRDGIVVHLADRSQSGSTRVLIKDVLVTGNRGNGVALLAEGAEADTQTMIDSSFIGRNEGNGVRIDASNVGIFNSYIGVGRDGTAQPNGMAGVVVGDSGTDAKLEWNVIAFNGGAGVDVSEAAKTVSISSLFHSNGRLGIDRHGDSPPRPVITSAVFDAARNVTIVEGEVVEPPPATDAYGALIVSLTFFQNTVPDLSGFGEGEAFAVHPHGPYYPLVISDGRFHAELPGDLRGRFLTATATYMQCYGLDGCWFRDTSEFSRAMAVQ